MSTLIPQIASSFFRGLLFAGCGFLSTTCLDVVSRRDAQEMPEAGAMLSEQISKNEHDQLVSLAAIQPNHIEDADVVFANYMFEVDAMRTASDTLRRWLQNASPSTFDCADDVVNERVARAERFAESDVHQHMLALSDQYIAALTRLRPDNASLLERAQRARLAHVMFQEGYLPIELPPGFTCDVAALVEPEMFSNESEYQDFLTTYMVKLDSLLRQLNGVVWYAGRDARPAIRAYRAGIDSPHAKDLLVVATSLAETQIVKPQELCAQVRALHRSCIQTASSHLNDKASLAFWEHAYAKLLAPIATTAIVDANESIEAMRKLAQNTPAEAPAIEGLIQSFRLNRNDILSRLDESIAIAFDPQAIRNSYSTYVESLLEGIRPTDTLEIEKSKVQQELAALSSAVQEFDKQRARYERPQSSGDQ